MTAGSLSATAAGVIALVIGLVLAWQNDAPRTRIALLICGAATVTAGVFADITGKLTGVIERFSETATSTVFGTSVGIIGLALLTWVIVRGVWKGGISHWTDTAAVLTPPLASAAGGLVWAVCLLVATVVVWLMQSGWDLLGSLAVALRGVAG